MIALATADTRHATFRASASDPLAVEIISIVAAEFGLTEREMLTPTRDHRIFMPRMAAMYYTRLLTQCSLPELGRLFGDRSHTTVLRAFRRCRQMIDNDPAWAARMDKLLVRLVENIISRN